MTDAALLEPAVGGTDDNETETHEDAAPPAEGVDPVGATLPSLDPVHLDGMFVGLARIIGQSEGTLLLAIAKMKDGTLRVSIQPPVTKDEPTGSALPLILVGAPEELDRAFLDHLAVYVPARNYAVASVAAVAQATKIAADTARAKTAKTPATKPEITSQRRTPTAAAPAVPPAPKPTPEPPIKRGCGRVIIVTVPADAAIRIEDAKGKTHTAKSGEPVDLPIGKATITATHADFNTKFATGTIAEGKKTIDLELPPKAASLFAVPDPVPAAPVASVESAAETSNAAAPDPASASDATDNEEPLEDPTITEVDDLAESGDEADNDDAITLD